MIVLDSSVLIGIIKFEQDSEKLFNVLAVEECAIGAPTLVETRLWCTANLPSHSSEWLEDFINEPRILVVPFSREMADVASRAFGNFGRAGSKRHISQHRCNCY